MQLEEENAEMDGKLRQSLPSNDEVDPITLPCPRFYNCQAGLTRKERLKQASSRLSRQTTPR